MRGRARVGCSRAEGDVGRESPATSQALYRNFVTETIVCLVRTVADVDGADRAK